MGNFLGHIVNQRFRKVFVELEERKIIKGKSDIAKSLGTYNHVINSILKGDRNITVDQLSKLFEQFQINANYLFGISDNMFRPEASYNDVIPTQSLEDRFDGLHNNITLYPQQALAGDALASDPDYPDENLPKFSVPGLSGDLVGIEISGDSMYPTLTNGDIVVCEPLDRGAPLRDNQVYVIVTDVVVAKRIQQIQGHPDGPRLRLISDNGAVYKPYELNLEDIRQVLKVRCRLTDHALV